MQNKEEILKEIDSVKMQISFADMSALTAPEEEKENWSKKLSDLQTRLGELEKDLAECVVYDGEHAASIIDDAAADAMLNEILNMSEQTEPPLEPDNGTEVLADAVIDRILTINENDIPTDTDAEVNRICYSDYPEMPLDNDTDILADAMVDNIIITSDKIPDNNSGEGVLSDAQADAILNDIINSTASEQEAQSEQPIFAEPMYAQAAPQAEQPIFAESTAPVYGQTVVQPEQPIFAEPVYAQTAPQAEQPIFAEPIAPVYGQTVVQPEQPIFAEPVYAQTAPQAEQPIFAEPTAPVYEQPTVKAETDTSFGGIDPNEPLDPMFDCKYEVPEMQFAPSGGETVSPVQNESVQEVPLPPESDYFDADAMLREILAATETQPQDNVAGERQTNQGAQYSTDDFNSRLSAVKASDSTDAETLLQIEKLKLEAEDAKRRAESALKEAEQIKKEAEQIRLAAESERAMYAAEMEIQRGLRTQEDTLRETTDRAEKERIAEKIARRKAEITAIRNGLQEVKDSDGAFIVREKLFAVQLVLDEDERNSPEISYLLTKSLDDIAHMVEVSELKRKIAALVAASKKQTEQAAEAKKRAAQAAAKKRAAHAAAKKAAAKKAAHAKQVAKKKKAAARRNAMMMRMMMSRRR